MKSILLEVELHLRLTDDPRHVGTVLIPAPEHRHSPRRATYPHLPTSRRRGERRFPDRPDPAAPRCARSAARGAARQCVGFPIVSLSTSEVRAMASPEFESRARCLGVTAREEKKG